MILEGIVYDPKGGSVAIMDGTLVRVGDLVGETEILSIEPSQVLVLKEGVEQALRLPGVEWEADEGS